MTQHTAMGVGQSTRYKALVVNGKFTGSADSQHFWPYGLNYESEWSTVNGPRQARIVAAMKLDGI
jgi:hypothetical protein